MKTFAIRCLVTAVVLCAVSSGVLGNVPRMLTLQGKLTDSLGQPVPDGVQSVTFRLYGVETCGQGDVLWQEVQNVQTNGGIFSVNLGAGTALTVAFDTQYWLGMQPASSGELCPRTRLTAVPYAVVAETVANAGITTEKIAAGAVTADKLAQGVAVPPGTIVMWSGSTSDVPHGWVLCNGQNQTPDLRDRFVVGAGGTYNTGSTGGSCTLDLQHSHISDLHQHNAKHGHTASSVANHSHRMDFSTQSATMYYPSRSPTGNPQDVLDFTHTHRVVGDTWESGGHSHTIYRNDFSTGNASDRGMSSALSDSVDNRPLYYAICFIMKLDY